MQHHNTMLVVWQCNNTIWWYCNALTQCTAGGIAAQVVAGAALNTRPGSPSRLIVLAARVIIRLAIIIIITIIITIMKISTAQIPGLILRIQPPGKFASLNTLRARHVAIFWLLLVRAFIVFSPGIILWSWKHFETACNPEIAAFVLGINLHEILCKNLNGAFGASQLS